MILKKYTHLYILFYLFTFVIPKVNAQSSWSDSPSELEIPTEEELFKLNSDPVVVSAQTAVRLKKIQNIIPLDYNDHVQKYITFYTSKKEHVSKVLGRAKRFFPIFEPIFAKYGIPDEMKYLAVVESALNPFAKSPVGATGPWQFMYGTGLQYDLTISKKVDERKDPYKSCEAAAKYLKEKYNYYGDWQLAIASYNCGAGNVNKAIKRAGGSKNFWDIRPYLPGETAAYVPSFIAMVYAMKYAKNYNVIPTPLGRENTQRVTLKEKISVNDLEKILGISKTIIVEENPSLLTTLVPEDYILNIPISKLMSFYDYQDSLYANAENITVAQKLDAPVVLKPESSPKDKGIVVTEEMAANQFSNKPIVKTNTTKPEKSIAAVVKKEEKKSTLSTTVNDVKNKLYEVKDAVTNNKKEVKTADKSKKTEPIATANVKKTEVKKDTKISEKDKLKNDTKKSTTSKVESPKVVVSKIEKEDLDEYKPLVYKVKTGDNLGYIASWFHCNVKEIRRWNELNGNFIDIDKELLIYIHKNDYSKFVRFNFLSNRLKDDLSKNIVTQEEKEATITQKKENDKQSIIQKINPVKYIKGDCYEKYKVKSGENLWTIAQKYDDVSVQDLMTWNGYQKTPLLKPGDEIKVRKIACK